MVVDTNVGFNKTNLLIKRETRYNIDLRDTDQPTAALTITYTHNGPTETAVCQQGESAHKYNQGYLSLADDCYFTYLRVYAPEGSILTNSNNHVVPAETLLSQEEWSSHADSSNEQKGFVTFSNFIIVPRGERVESHYAYNLPTDVIQHEDGNHQYQLTLHKQAGLHAEPVQINVQLPSGAELQQSSIPVSDDNNGNLQFDLLLDTTTTITITYHNNK